MHEALTGSFCWLELATTDLERAAEFYGRLFPWEQVGPALAPSMLSYLEYYLLRSPGGDVAGVYELLKEQRAADVRSHWLPYVGVESADRIAERAASLGGAVVAAPTDVLEMGRMAVLRDPTGEQFAVWEAGVHVGFQTSDQHGHPAWLELTSSDPERATTFLTELFGWKREAAGMGRATRTVLSRAGAPVVSIEGLSVPGEDRQPGWLVFFGVSDIEACCKSIAARRGRVIVPPQAIPGIGRFATAIDPQGARFALVEPA